MDLKRTWAISRKELIHIRRDPISLLQIILLPVVLLLLYGYALTFDIKNVTMAIYDQERSQLSEDFINQFRGSDYFRIAKYTNDYNELQRLILERQVQVGLMLPYDFSWQYQTGKTAKVQALVDGTDSNTANIVLGYLQAVTAAYNQQLLAQRLTIKGPGGREMPVDAQTRFWFNEDLESRNYIVPGLIVIIMTMVGALLTALTVVRELERGSMEGLMATPLKRTELLLGKIGPYFMIGMFDMVLVMAMAKLLFQVPLRGSPLLLIGLAAIFLIATLGQGLLISVTSENQLQAFQTGHAHHLLAVLSVVRLRVFHLPDAPAAPDRLLHRAGPVPGDHFQGHLPQGPGNGLFVAQRRDADCGRHLFCGNVHQEVRQED